MIDRSSRNPVFKGLYRGYGIYWHGGKNYGDETQVLATSIRAMQEKIDAHVAALEAQKTPEEKYWDSLTSEERTHWRRLCQTTELSASELAYTNRTGTA